MFLFTKRTLRKHTTAGGDHVIKNHIIFLRLRYITAELEIQTHDVYENSLSVKHT